LCVEPQPEFRTIPFLFERTGLVMNAASGVTRSVEVGAQDVVTEAVVFGGATDIDYCKQRAG
jgi:hypothetical protein